MVPSLWAFASAVAPHICACSCIPVPCSEGKKVTPSESSSSDRQTGFGAPANLADWPRQGSNPGPTDFARRKGYPDRFRGSPPRSSVDAVPNLLVLSLPCQVVGDVTPTPCAPPSKGRPLAPAEAYPAARRVRCRGWVTVNRPTRPDRDPARLINRRACALRFTLTRHISSIWFRIQLHASAHSLLGYIHCQG